MIKTNLDVDDEMLKNIGIMKKPKHKRIKAQINSSSEEEEVHQPAPKKSKKLPQQQRPAQNKHHQQTAAYEEEEEEAEEEAEEEEGGGGDSDNFIVSDSDEENEENRTGVRKKRPKAHTMNDEAQQEAHEIFGINADELGILDESGDDEEDDDDEELIEDEIDEDDVEGQIARAKKKRQIKSKHNMEDIFEPAELERNYLTKLDQKICNVDEPERFILRRTPVTPELNELELDKEAEWVYKQLFEQKRSISKQEHQKLHPSVISKIRDTLRFMRNECLEVPFIAFYRKEYIEADWVEEDHEYRSRQLWKIFEYDEKYCQLKRRKENLVKLLQRMQKYQMTKEEIREMRVIEEADIENVKRVETNEEYFDVYKHFKLYYLNDLDEMRSLESPNERQQQQQQDEEVVEAEVEKELKKKSAHRKDMYYYCRLGGLVQFAKRYGLSAEQFGENLVAEYQKHEIVQWGYEPNHLASEFISQRFDDVEKVILGGRHIMAMQIARDTNVKSFVRDLYMKRAVVQCRPTKKGLKEIDENHQCYAFKYLKEKPVISFENDEYLRIYQAKKDGLVEVRFEVDTEAAIIYANDEVNREVSRGGGGEEDYDAPVVNLQLQTIANMPRQTINETLKNYFQKDEFSYNVQQWNQQRAEVVDEVLNKILYPELEQELETRLVNEAKEFVKKECKKRIKELINVAPYKAEAQHFDDLDQSDEYSCRVFAISYSGDPNEVAVCACVNGNGELDEFIRIRKFLSRGTDPRFAQDRMEKRDDMEKLFKLIVKKRPHVIAIGAENKDALFVIEELKKELEKVEKEKQIGMIGVELVDNDLAKLYASTNLADAEFRDQPPLLKQSIALARQLQDPLLAYAQLCNTDADILLLKYHPLQDLLSKEELLSAIEQEFIDETNLVGVDLNRCVKYPHTAHVLQFVSALGPRKSSHIIKTSKHKLPILTRSFLVTECTLGSKVFVNCAGFIKFDTEALQKENDDSEDIEVFDSMRIHPEAYEWARQMCADALDLDDNNDRSSAVKEILESPGRLDTLELDAFAAELERVGSGKRHITLVDIRREFHNCYEERRVQHRSPNDNEKFHMLTKETVVSFKNGKLVMCRVTSIARRRPTKEQLENAEPIKDENTCTWQCSFCKRGNFSELGQVWTHFDTDDCPGPPVGVRTILDNQVNGFIPLGALSDQIVKNPEDRLKIGQLIYARITKIDVAKFSVELTSRSSDLKDTNGQYRPKRDMFYDNVQENEDAARSEERKRRDEHRQAFTKRVIAHPQFHNIGYQESINMLKEMEIGDSVIRPSSKGIDHLTLTWKVFKDIYQHVDIVEEKKVNQFSLGKRLIIDGEEYEDLDEILARYVHPIGTYSRECINYKYFRPDLDSTKRDQIESVLTSEQKSAPSKIPYAFICDRINPGHFLLSYVIKTKVRHECVKVTPEGFRFRGQLHRTFNNLINWFKKHFNDPIPIAVSRVGTPAATAGAAGGSQRSLTSNSPFITPAAPTPRSLASTPALITPNRSTTTPNRGSLTPYSPTNATTPHLQNFENSSAPMDVDNFRRPNSNFRGGGYNNRGSGGGFSKNSNEDESWDDDTPSTGVAPPQPQPVVNNNRSNNWNRPTPTKSFNNNNDDESWEETSTTTTITTISRPPPPPPSVATSSFNSKTNNNESSWFNNNKPPAVARQSRFAPDYSAPIKQTSTSFSQSKADVDESWDEPTPVQQIKPQQQIRSPYKAPPPPQIQQKKPPPPPVFNKKPTDEESWD